MHAPRRWLALAVVVVAATAACGGSGRSAAPGPSTTTTTIGATTPDVAIATDPPGPTKVLAVGDSLAFLLSYALERKGTPNGWVVHNAGVLGCGILPGVSLRYGQPKTLATVCGGVPALWQRELDEFDPDVVIVLDGFWDAYDWIIDGQTVAFGTPEWDAFAAERFGAAMDELSSNGRRVVWLLSPYFRPDKLEPQIVQYYRTHGRYDSALDDDRVRHLNDLFRSLASERSCAVNIVDIRPCVCPGDAYTDVIDGFEVRGDGVHFTDAGADRLADYVIPRVMLATGSEC